MPEPNQACDFLGTAYEQLGFAAGSEFFHLEDYSGFAGYPHTDWLLQAQDLGAESIYLVNGNPTALFFRMDETLIDGSDFTEEQIHNLHIKVWNTSRIPLFFVALPLEIRVYSAFKTPVRRPDEWRSENQFIEVAKLVSEVGDKLADFSRSKIESGYVFDKYQEYFKRENKVDQWLLRNLISLRYELEGDDKQHREEAHALIGRSIFIRYLEDRKILVKDYFSDISDGGEARSYHDCLTNKDLTYKLFDKISKDFNGDIFPISPHEVEVMTQDKLSLLRDFLLGKELGDQPSLFFWAYKFDIIPIELISTIYEEFYHDNGGINDVGTHYTPTSLVHFVLMETLTRERLLAKARILDPACGSGIFLVEALKAIIYHEAAERKVSPKDLPRSLLTEILTERIVGIDVNESAIKVAAFSLYLAYLDFIDPPDIREQKTLPDLIYDVTGERTGKTLYVNDIFTLTKDEYSWVESKVVENKRYLGRTDHCFLLSKGILPLESYKFDVIFGNPPWGGDSGEDISIPAKWCDTFNYTVGDKELSQCFISRLHHLLAPNGVVGLLVSTGILFKHHENSKKFRKQWLARNKIHAIYNFAHVRDVFFKKQKKEAISPFIALIFSKSDSDREDDILNNWISYFSIKRTLFIEHLQAVIIDKTSLRRARQSDFLRKEWLWKTYMWGDIQDAELIEEMKTSYPPLKTFVNSFGRGYQEGGGQKKCHTDRLVVNFEIKHGTAKYIGALRSGAKISNYLMVIAPRHIHALGQPHVFQGPRVLVKRGVSRSGERNGEIVSCLTDVSFAFRNSIIGLKVDALTENKRLVLLAIMKSSIAKYYHFLTCSTWGFWHDEIHLEEHLTLPIHFPDSEIIFEKIITALAELVAYDEHLYIEKPYSKSWTEAQDALDQAIFELYDLSNSQKDLVRDLCDVSLDFFYKGTESSAVRYPSYVSLCEYKDAFIDIWSQRLATRSKKLIASIYYSGSSSLLCGISFQVLDIDAEVVDNCFTNEGENNQWISELSKSLLKEKSSQIYVDRVVKSLDGSGIVIIKRAEYRLWTKSQARQDAAELLTEVFKLEWQRMRGRENGLG